MDSKRKDVIEKSEISETRTYTLGGFKQRVVFDGMKKENPICLFLHGGPGSPVPFCEGARGLFPEISAHVTCVFWDQLGCGINDCPIDETFTIKNFTDMTVDLIKNIKADFPNNKLIIFAVSWGSILSANAANQVPELIDRVYVYGQILRELAFSDEIFETLDKSAMSQKNLKLVSEIKSRRKEYRIDDIKTVMKFVSKYTEGYQSKTGGKLPIMQFVKGILKSPDYKFRDLKASLIMNGTMKNKSLMVELVKCDLTETLKDVQIPYYIMQGEKDIVTSTNNIKKFVEASGNDNLKLEIVPDSGHVPGAKSMDFIIKKLLSSTNS